MKLTKAQLKRIIKEELSKVLNEGALENALFKQLRNLAGAPASLEDLFDDQKGTVWAQMEQDGATPAEIQLAKKEKAAFYRGRGPQVNTFEDEEGRNGWYGPLNNEFQWAVSGPQGSETIKLRQDLS